MGGNEMTEEIELRLTCDSCPEQYDAYAGGKKVGYLRVRHRWFRVDCPDYGGETVLYVEVNGAGQFQKLEREGWLTTAKKCIAEWMAKQ
jgi:hypothetical protein